MTHITLPACSLCHTRGARVYRPCGDSMPIRCAACSEDPTRESLIPAVLDANGYLIVMSQLTPAQVSAFLSYPEALGARLTYDPTHADQWVPIPLLSPPPPCAVFAVAEDGAFGLSGELPWRCPQDLRRFRALTWGGAVIAGQVTAATLPPLRERTLHTLRRGDSLSTMLRGLRHQPRVAVIGGATVLREAVNPCRDITIAHVTIIKGRYTHDVRFDLPAWIEAGQWEIAASSHYPTCEFRTYVR